ncbi:MULTISPECIES: asparagine synthase (glutamine-hydrolyzing) [Colwellia]|uniref:asparagine synthase (glutamine-hydrolyzing) n=1 Tax=Colwellia marinimaniae TaxID=1513592 RepID=A0ABQ0MT74_9GAMM|nr:MULTISPECIES: asparagine synthase (glutamine-hydrolyzing) [Colwellia]GAW95524.1 amidotransferase 1, exosortase A system-associated [Colwellia marinimaniae]
MCGIAGFTQFHQQQGSIDTLKTMGNQIFHRGPDAGSEYLTESVGLCHRRLAIIDLSDAGIQPMHSSDEQVIISFNGEIYNFLELREELIAKGIEFKTDTDTEVIIALYQSIGIKLLDKINGMFAFAIWDNIKQELFLARDRIGKKPLYYSFFNNDLVFASELKAMLVLPSIPKDIRLDAVHDFFAYQYIPDPKTIFQGIYKLEPGHYLTVNKNGIKNKQYWDISFSKQTEQSEPELIKELQQLVGDCTAKRMVSDVPLGAFLSGGVDSSGIVALMAEQAEKTNGEAITTCSIGFDEEKFDETKYAAIVAKQYGTNHHKLTVQENVEDNLEHIVSFFDEPFADPSLVPTYFVSQLARQKVTVAISGDGGDEVFAGYEKYSADHMENNLRNKIPSWIRTNIFPALANVARSININACQRASSLLTSLSVEPAMGFYISNSFIKDTTWQTLINDKTKVELGDYHPSKLTTDFYHKCDGKDHLSRILYTDMKTYLPGGILVKVDRMSMANSLEVRAPLLDYKLIEFAATVPSKYKFNKGEKKYLLKEAFKKYLPDDILYRKKMGFSVPLASWLRNELKELTEAKLVENPSGLKKIFKTSEINKLWTEHIEKVNDHSTVLWSMLMFQMWWDKYMTEEQA